MIAHFPLERLRDMLELRGIGCVIRAGAQGKSARRFKAGYYVGCQSVVMHHTVSSGESPANDVAYIDGGQGSGHIISNAYVGRDGVVHLIASGPTYTEGAGGPYGIIPKDRANDVCFSIEIGNWGDSRLPYTEVQLRATREFAHCAATIAADVWDWPDDPFAPHRLFSHFEWTSRKIDPAGAPSPYMGPDDSYGRWDMDRFRSDVAALAKPTPIPQPPSPIGTDMPLTIWSHPKWANAWLIGGGGHPIHLTPKTIKLVEAPLIVEAHEQMLKSLLAMTGLTTADLVPRPTK